MTTKTSRSYTVWVRTSEGTWLKYNSRLSEALARDTAGIVSGNVKAVDAAQVRLRDKVIATYVDGKLTTTGERGRMGGSTKPPRANVSPRERKPTKNIDDPRGQFGAYLRHWLDTKYKGNEEPLAKALGVSERTIRKWTEGEHGPAFGDINRIAIAMGFRDWSELAATVRRHCIKVGLIQG